MKSKIKNSIKKFIPYWAGVKLRGWYQIFLGLWFRGKKYECPFCGHSFRKMMKGGEDHQVIYQKQIIGGGIRENIQCPRCFSKDRDRLVYIYLTKKMELLSSGPRVLHIAPEGALRAWLKKIKTIKYLMGDKYQSGYTDYYYSRDVGYADVTNLQYPDNEFDLIICNHVLEHVVDDEKAMAELYRVLNPGGTAILQVPISYAIPVTEEDSSVTSPEERIRLYGQFDHVRIYGPDYPQRLEKAGFRVTHFNPFSEGLEDIAKRYSLNPNEDLFLGIKD